MKLPVREVNEKGGVFDEELGREHTNFEAAQVIYSALGWQGIVLGMNGHLSEEADRVNSDVQKGVYDQGLRVMTISGLPPQEG